MAVDLWSQTRMSLKKISRESGIPGRRVMALAKALGLQRPDAPQAAAAALSWREQERQLVLKLWVDGIDLKSIAVRVGKSQQSVRDKLKRLGADLAAPRHVFEPGTPYLMAGTARKKGVAADWWRRT